VADTNLASLTADIVAAYVAANRVGVADLPALIESVHRALRGLNSPALEASPVDEVTKSRAEIRKSITPDALISFVDGRPYRTLKRHLSTYGMTMADYRGRYGLSEDYPSTAPSYSAQRSALARSTGLGRRRQQAPAPATDPEPVPAATPARKARRSKPAS
jgi:predicted transcriptional regulator